MTSASRCVTSASRYQSSPSTYNRSMIPRNFTELAEAVQIASCTSLSVIEEINPNMSEINPFQTYGSMHRISQIGPLYTLRRHRLLLKKRKSFLKIEFV